MVIKLMVMVPDVTISVIATTIPSTIANMTTIIAITATTATCV